MKHEHSEQRSLLRRTEGDRLAAPHDLQRPKYSELHYWSLPVPLVATVPSNPQAASSNRCRRIVAAAAVAGSTSAIISRLALIGIGLTAWLSADLRDEWRKLDRIERFLERRPDDAA